MRLFGRIAAWLWVFGGLGIGAAAAGAPAAPVDARGLEGVLSRAGEYVAGYAESFQNVVAREECRQTFRVGVYGRQAVRNTRADISVVHLAGPVPWVTFRDVYEVDGQRVRDEAHAGRLEALFRDSPATALPAARALLEESTRYNLGPLRRTVNVPTLALTFLEPENRSRFAFERKGDKTVAGARTVEVAFQEEQHPTLVRDDAGQDVPSAGRLWIDPADGAVLRTVVEYRYVSGDGGGSTARIATEYRRDPRLGIPVPVEMRETYVVAEAAVVPRGEHAPVRTGQATPTDVEPERSLRIEATSSYSGYRRFTVGTEESFRVEPTPEP